MEAKQFFYSFKWVLGNVSVPQDCVFLLGECLLGKSDYFDVACSDSEVHSKLASFLRTNLTHVKTHSEFEEFLVPFTSKPVRLSQTLALDVGIKLDNVQVAFNTEFPEEISKFLEVSGNSRVTPTQMHENLKKLLALGYAIKGQELKKFYQVIVSLIDVNRTYDR